MATRKEIINSFYEDYDENGRLDRRRCTQLEHFITNKYIHKYVKPGTKVLEIGAGTGRYSIPLAEEGCLVTAVEYCEKNLEELRINSMGIETIRSYSGDAVDLSRFPDNFFDVTLSFGPMYHLYDKEDVDKAINEAIRVTKPGGVIFFAFISMYAIMYSDFIYSNWNDWFSLNVGKDGKFQHVKEQVFTGYDVSEFEDLFTDKKVDWITTVGVDGSFEFIEHHPDFKISDEDFEKLKNWYLTVCEKRELLGTSSHLLYIGRKL